MLLFSFTHRKRTIPCALVQWFHKISDTPDEDTGMWVVQADEDVQPGVRDLTVVHLDTLLRCCHLLPKHGLFSVPYKLRHYHSLDAYDVFYVNKYADHHAHEIAW
jgi:hypothetical protein